MAGIGAIAALRHRNFRLYFLGQGVSVLGTWVQQVAMSWLVYRLTGSAELLGLIAFLTLAPQLIIAPLAGAWFDRYDRKRLLMGVQMALVCHASALATMTLGGVITPHILVAMALLLGLLNSLDIPLRQSLIGNLLDDRTAIRNALALNAMLFNTGRFVGPPIAGLILAVTSEGVCFTLNAFSFLALMGMLAVTEIRPSPPMKEQSYFLAVREGFDYAWKNMPQRLLLAHVILINFFGCSYSVLAPLLAREVFHGDERTLGLLIGAAGCGAVTATTFLAAWTNLRQVRNAMMVGAAAGAVALGLLSMTKVLPVGLAALAVIGFAISVVNVASNGLLQSLSPDHLRGRIASLFTAGRSGFDAIGGMTAGLIAGGLGAPNTLLLAGGLLAVGVAVLSPFFSKISLCTRKLQPETA